MDVTKLQAENLALSKQLENVQKEKAALAEQLESIQEQYTETLKEKDQENRYLRDRIQALNKRLFGPRSEKIDPGQLLLEFMEEETETPPHVLEALDDEEEPSRKKRKAGRKPIPKDLPRKRVEYALSEEERACTCCGDPMQPFGEEITEELEIIPASLYVVEHARLKYSCKKCQEGVAIAKLPKRPIEKGKPGPGLLAQIVVAKYADHMPLQRQEKIYVRQGLDLSKSTLCDWIATSAELLKLIYLELKRQILLSKVVQSDDTHVMMQENYKKGGRKRCFLWAYRGDQGDVVFDFTTSRSRAGPLKFFQNYEGYVQADAYSGYDALFRRPEVVEVGCWAHCRRYFVKAMDSHVEEAAPILAGVRRLYKLESEIKERTAEEIQQSRQEKAKPILEDIHKKLILEQPMALPQSALGKAIGYALKNWDALTRYVEDGDLDIDNNAIEREMRSIAVGRKNSYDRLSIFRYKDFPGFKRSRSLGV